MGKSVSNVFKYRVILPSNMKARYMPNTFKVKSNNKVTEHFINPMYLNTEELTLNDILVAAYTSNADRFRSEEMNIVSYITYKYEWFGLIVLLLIVLLCRFTRVFT